MGPNYWRGCATSFGVDDCQVLISHTPEALGGGSPSSSHAWAAVDDSGNHFDPCTLFSLILKSVAPNPSPEAVQRSTCHRDGHWFLEASSGQLQTSL